MFVFLSKFLPLFIYPLGLAFFLLIVTLFLRKHDRLRKGVIVGVIVILWVCSTPWLPVSLAKSLEWRYLPQAEVPTADVIVVLGGGTDSHDYPRPTAEINGAGDRVLYAARLYLAGKADHLLLSGGNIDYVETRGTTPAAEMAEILELIGVPQDALWLQPNSQNTAEDAEFCAQILKEKGINRIILVTSAMHMPRSVALFEKQGLEVIPAPTDYGVTQKRWDSLFSLDPETLSINLIPSASNLSLTTTALKEYIGMVVYRLKGWM